MIFAEYIEHDPAVPFQLFRHHGRQDWVGERDRLIANLGRTMRLGGEPHYLVWWQIKGFERIDEWETFFRTPEGRLYTAETPVPRAVRFTRNALFDVVLGSDNVPPGLHLLELFQADDLTHEALRGAFQARARAVAPAQLLYVLKRVATLAPDPGGMALWTFPSYAAAEPFLRAAPPPGFPAILTSGFYRNFGDEIV